MEIYHDGVPVYELPEYAVCKADEKKRNPLYMDVCPMGYEDCVDGCENYREEWQEREDDIMMDAINFLKEKKRMCALNVGCLNCPIGILNNKFGEPCRDFEKNHPEDAVAIIEKWSAEHPKKTRQSELLKAFPNAEIENGVAVACPKSLDKNVNCEPLNCDECTRKYWLEEVE